MARHNDLGKWGEDIAERYLRQRGYILLERDRRSEDTHNGGIVFARRCCHAAEDEEDRVGGKRIYQVEGHERRSAV